VSDLSFEKGTEKLQNLITSLEQPDIKLEDMLTTYEEGMRLIKQLQDKLSDAETKLILLNKDLEIDISDAVE
jgi:exodeoxyribonuclease VII small subunit